MKPRVKCRDAGVKGGEGSVTVSGSPFDLPESAQSTSCVRKYAERDTSMKRWEEKIAVDGSWLVDEKTPVSDMRISEYKRERHMNTRSLRSLSIRASSSLPSSGAVESNRNSKASPKPLLV